MNKVVDLKEIRKLTKELVVLYVEDEKDIREMMSKILSLFFVTIYIAEDGLDGLEQLEKNKVDLLITDIQMPRLNGLKLIEQSRAIYPDLPVIITTAFSEQSYFLQSIDLKVDKYLIKPIKQESVMDVIYQIAKMIDYRKKANELEMRKMQEKINQVSEHILAEITDSYQSPCIVYTDNQMRYINSAFCLLYDAAELERFLANEIQLESLFDKRPDFMSKLDEYNEEDLSKNRISISKENGRKIYRVKRKEIVIDEGNKPSEIYFFIDITLEEYQKIKIKNYTSLLEDMIFDLRYRNMKKTLPQHTLNETVAVPKVEITEQEAEIDSQKLVISSEENQLLRRSHTQKTTAKVYVSELDEEILQELQELDELDKDFSDSIMIFQEDSNIDGLHQMASQLDQYAHVINLLFEFGDLSYAIRSLSNFLSSVQESQLDEKKMRKIGIILDGIKSDLAAWRQVIFIMQSSLDIHYLDSSLFSACLQIELLLSEDVKEMESEEDDLILF